MRGRRLISTSSIAVIVVNFHLEIPSPRTNTTLLWGKPMALIKCT